MTMTGLRWFLMICCCAHTGLIIILTTARLDKPRYRRGTLGGEISHGLRGLRCVRGCRGAVLSATVRQADRWLR